MKRSKVRFLSMLLVSAILLGIFAGMAGASTSYTVQKGDSLFFIAKRFGVTVSALKSANGLSGNLIYPGQRLTVPDGAKSGTRYTVVRGDTLYLISQRFGVSVSSIKSANNLTGNTLYPGQVLSIPGNSVRSSTNISRSFSRSDLDLLARAVYAEARGEVYQGQVGVAAVILNRVKNPVFPSTIPGVIYEPLAFSSVADGQINLPANETAYKAVQDALNGWDPTYGALYFWNPATAESKWVWSRTITVKIGNHVFAR